VFAYVQSKNVTFSLPVELMEKYKGYAKSNDIPSVNGAVKEAMEEYSVKIEKKKLKQQMLKAAKDPLFMKDLEESMLAFESSDVEATKGETE
jgi:DNA replicative helicase MCM subunit Mcm2 (Cdc46/Mcm family)